MDSFLRDIKEINMFINSSNITNCVDDFSLCLKLLTEPTEDKYNNSKANYYRNVIKVDAEFKNSIQKLASFCNKSTCSDCPINKYCNHYINSLRKKNNAKFKLIDLFCGAGGLSLGFTQEGFTVVLANDIQECCIDTYSHNHPEVVRNNIILGDINEITDHINKYVKTNIDVVVGGPPCQGFSMANRQRMIDDPRNSLYKNFVEIVNKTKPSYFVMENVKGMMSVAQQVVEDFSKIGYQVQYKVLNAKDYGVPQNRERLIYIGSNVDENISIIFNEIDLEKTKIKKHTLKDAIYGLRPLKASTIRNSTEDGSCSSGFVIERNKYQKTNDYISLINQNKKYEYVLNHQARYNNDRDIEIYSRLNQGDKSDDPKIADIMPYKNRKDIFKDKYYKLENNKICKTITAHMKFDCNMYIHPTQARGLTPREAARIQSYPDDYFFRGAYTKTYMQIGNSVPPLLGRAIATVIKKHIKENENGIY